MERKPTMPTRTLLQGMPYTPAARTDIKATFERFRKQQPANVKQLRRSK
jgi:hypothetical protein